MKSNTDSLNLSEVFMIAMWAAAVRKPLYLPGIHLALSPLLASNWMEDVMCNYLADEKRVEAFV